VKGEIERTVRSFEDRIYGGSEDGHTRVHWHVTTDGEFERQVGLHHSSAPNGEHGDLLTPKAARRLARALNTAAARAEREQGVIDREGERGLNRRIRRHAALLKPKAAKQTLATLKAAHARGLGLTPDRIRQAREDGGGLQSELEGALTPRSRR
jgi:hypothetical protein